MLAKQNIPPLRGEGLPACDQACTITKRVTAAAVQGSSDPEILPGISLAGDHPWQWPRQMAGLLGVDWGFRWIRWRFFLQHRAWKLPGVIMVPAMFTKDVFLKMLGTAPWPWEQARYYSFNSCFKPIGSSHAGDHLGMLLVEYPQQVLLQFAHL